VLAGEGGAGGDEVGGGALEREDHRLLTPSVGCARYQGVAIANGAHTRRPGRNEKASSRVPVGVSVGVNLADTRSPVTRREEGRCTSDESFVCGTHPSRRRV
jgi:hypothetical protein